MAQNPESTEFDGMPNSAIASGLVDYILPPAEMPARLIAYARHAFAKPHSTTAALPPGSEAALQKIFVLLRAQTGHDFSQYKPSTIHRRIERRMAVHQAEAMTDYLSYLQQTPAEVEALFRDLLIGVTNFFRDPEAFQALEDEVIPQIFAGKPAVGGTIRVWTAGCSTGEEAYSLAIVFCEALQQLKPAAPCTLQIFATDLDPDAINKARIGVYPSDISADVSEERLRRFFVPKDRGYRVSSEIREMIIFAPQNLVMDPPFTKLDLLSCRNLLIYLEPELQKKLLPLFHYSLKPGGYLILGSAETVGEASELFSALPGRTRLYQRLDQEVNAELASFPSIAPGRRLSNIQKMTLPTPSSYPAPNLQMLIDAVLLQHFCPSAVLTSDKGDIVYISGKTGKYLEPAVGKANLNLFAMAREGLGGELSAAFAKAVRDNAAVRLKSLAVSTEGGTQFVDLTVLPLAEPEALKGMMLIVFAESFPPLSVRTEDRAADSPEHRLKMNAVAEELKQCRDELHLTRGEMQSSQEELRSANEELQSINEELTTSKEEMQSMNEELQTVNYELQAKVDALSQASDDMKNLLNSAHIATLFLDDGLKVRRFTNQTASIIKLIPGDAGRPITDLVTELQYPELADDMREVLRSLVFRECQVPARDGRWFNVRIMPYRTQDNRIDGVVITFFDITGAKVLEETLRETLAALQSRLAQATKGPDRTQQLEQVLMQAHAILEQGLASVRP